MVSTIPAVGRAAGKGRAVSTAVMHLMASGVAGASFGAALTVVGRPIAETVGPPWLALGWGVLALVLGLGELEVVRVPRPEHNWQVPARWRKQFPPEVAAALYGGILGIGVLTRISFASFYVLVAWVLLSGDVRAGAMAFGVFGLARGVPPTAVALLFQTTESIDRLGHALMPLHERVGRATGLILVSMAALVLVGANP